MCFQVNQPRVTPQDLNIKPHNHFVAYKNHFFGGGGGKK
jgi:hypothetical protein